MQEAEIFGISAAWVIANAWSLVIALLVLGAGWVISIVEPSAPVGAWGL